MTFKSIFAGIITLLLLSGCSDPNAPIIERESAAIKIQITDLKSSLDNGTLPNATILKTYISKTKASHPEYAGVLLALAPNATSQSSGITRLEGRLAEVHSSMATNAITSDEAVNELANLKAASRADIYNDSLVDEINTVASLSGGVLLPIDQPNSDAAMTPGSNLVGNPKYGSWNNRSSGSSFWVWYGQYSMFRAVFGRPGYSSWYYNRPWSHGYDVYNNRYGSRRWKANESGTLNRNYSQVRSYGRANNRKPSSYAGRNNSKSKIRAVGRGSSLSSTRRQTATYGPSATRKSSSYASSSRSGTRSRSSRGGK